MSIDLADLNVSECVKGKANKDDAKDVMGTQTGLDRLRKSRRLVLRVPGDRVRVCKTE